MNRKNIFIFSLGVILFLQIGSCRFLGDIESSVVPPNPGDVTITSQFSATLESSQTEALPLTSTPEPTATATITSTETIVPTATQESILLPDWVTDSNSELYLCIAPDENSEMHLAIANPVSQEIFLFSIKERDIQAYFWVPEPKHGIGWVNHRFDEYSILDFSTGTIESYMISRDSDMFITHSFSGNKEPTNFSEHAYPVKMIVLNNDEVYFIRQDIGDLGGDFSKNISPNEQFYIFEVLLKEDPLGNYTQINGYDFQKQQEISYDIPGIYVRQSIVNWLPNSNTFVEIGDYIVDMSDGSIIQELPKSEQERAWNSNGEEFYFNPISIWNFYSTDRTKGTQILVYNIRQQTTEKLVGIDEYFQHHDTFALHEEFLDNLTYIPSLDLLGFSYFGTGGTAGGQEISTAGGYCLYSFVTSEINCVTDAIEEMLIILDESANYTAREEMVFAQWSNSNRFIAFFVQRADDPPRLLMYDLETGSYFFINNHNIDSPLGIWSP